MKNLLLPRVLWIGRQNGRTFEIDRVFEPFEFWIFWIYQSGQRRKIIIHEWNCFHCIYTSYILLMYTSLSTDLLARKFIWARFLSALFPAILHDGPSIYQNSTSVAKFHLFNHHRSHFEEDRGWYRFSVVFDSVWLMSSRNEMGYSSLSFYSINTLHIVLMHSSTRILVIKNRDEITRRVALFVRAFVGD